ncbi:MAG: cell division protein FtsL [Acidiferrobacterales bacterium]
MGKRVAALVIAVMVSALAVVYLRQRNRMDFVELQALQSERDNLNIERGKLLLEEGTWSEHRRIEEIARTRLGMAPPSQDQVIIVYVHGGRQ